MHGNHDDLTGLSIALTGAAGDIGSAIARELVGRGATVHGLDIRDDGAATVVEMSYHRVDVRDGAAVGATLAALPALDVLIAGAGIVESAPVLSITAEQWQHQLDVNLTGSFNVAQAAARLMVSRGSGGRIVFIGSWIQEVPWPEVAAYSVTKAGIRMLARSMALELAQYGILVNVVAPGIVDAGTARHQRLTEPRYAERAAKVIPLGRLQSAEQVARATAYLCSPACDYMTGAVLLVDGGCSLFHVESS